MSWLYFDDNINKVVIKPDALDIPEVKKVYKKDRQTKEKPYFNKVIKYMWHCFSPDHSLSNHFPQQRIQKVKDIHFEGQDMSKVENDKDVKAMIEVYLDDSLTPSERFYEGIKGDMADLLAHIRTIPMYHSINSARIVKVEYPNEKGKMVEVDAKTKLPIKLDNSKEKFDAISRADKIMELAEKLLARVKQEKRKEKQKKAMFDQ